MAQDTSSIREAVRRYVRELSQHGIRVQGVLRYGSFAKNAAHAGNDIDVIIISDDFAGKNLPRLKLAMRKRRW